MFATPSTSRSTLDKPELFQCGNGFIIRASSEEQRVGAGWLFQQKLGSVRQSAVRDLEIAFANPIDRISPTIQIRIWSPKMEGVALTSTGETRYYSLECMREKISEAVKKLRDPDGDIISDSLISRRENKVRLQISDPPTLAYQEDIDLYGLTGAHLVWEISSPAHYYAPYLKEVVNCLVTGGVVSHSVLDQVTEILQLDRFKDLVELEQRLAIASGKISLNNESMAGFKSLG